jgi:hypothetical protein
VVCDNFPVVSLLSFFSHFFQRRSIIMEINFASTKKFRANFIRRIFITRPI